MTAAHYWVIETPIGALGLAWRGASLTRLQLPEAGADATERRLRRRAAAASPQPPPPAIEAVIAELRRYLTGARVDFADVSLDLTEVDAVDRSVYDAARLIGWGRTATYGDLARGTDYPQGARTVGQALARNPVAIVIPCHRILARGDRIGGFSAHGGIATKERLLALEGVRLGADAPRLPGL